MTAQITRREFLRQLILASAGIAAGACTPGPPRGTQDVSDDVQPITILYVNDLHGALYPKPEEGGERGGAANLVGLIDRKRAEADGPLLLLDAGDAFQGTYISNSNQGQAVIEIMNTAGVNAFVLGNHEFDWGMEILQARIEQAKFPCLAANLETTTGQPLPEIAPYTVLDAGGIKVGVLGLTYHDIQTIVKASAIEGLRSRPAAETVGQYLPELRKQADVIIILSHLGLANDKALAHAMPEIPIIIGGHSHRALPQGEQIGDTLIAQAGAYGEYLGQIVIQFDRRRKRILDAQAKLIKVTDAGTPNAEVEAIVRKWGQEAERVGSQVIGQTTIALKAIRGQETALGNLITDAMRAADLGDGRAFDIALHNDGGIRADLEAGSVTYAEMYAVLPFDNTLVGLDLTGKQVKEMLETGIGNHSSEIQVSGLNLVYTLNKSRGRRVMEVTVHGEPLDPDRTYRVVTIDYLYTHPQYRLSLGQGSNVFYGGLCLDAVIEYVRTHSPVRPQVEQRISKL